MENFYMALESVIRRIHRRVDCEVHDAVCDFAETFNRARRSNAQQCRRALDRLAESQR